MIRYIREEKNIEIGGAEVLLNGKKVERGSIDWEIVHAIRKDFPEEFGKVSQKIDKKFYDIVLDKATIKIMDEDGKVLIDKKLSDTEYLKKQLQKVK